MIDQNIAIGVDIGGTFTDIVTIRDDTISVTKRPTTTGTPHEGILQELAEYDQSGFCSIDEIEYFAHGTTVATNAVLEQNWAETALVTNKGFRDVLEIGRQTRPDIYDLHTTKPAPVVERDRRFGVGGRIDEHGNIEEPLNESDLDDVIRAIDEMDVESVAVSLLFAYENDMHERQIYERLIDALPHLSISLSSVVLPEIREYERTLATAMNAALKPIMDSYLGSLESGLSTIDLNVPLHIMQSNGGTISAKRARETPVNTLLSGPAAGVQGAAHIADLCGYLDVLTMDMGGTSCDVSLVTDGDPVIATDVTVGAYPINIPMVTVHTIGAGGGSIAWIDSGGALRVGPKSAGADPGPVCYGRGGLSPTVTDAQLILGRLPSDGLLSEELSVDLDAVVEAIETKLAEPLGMSVMEAAQGVVDVANSNMERALRVVSVEQGYDPRKFGLVAFGGAGPLHASKLADSLDIPKVLIPRSAGVLSALGLLISDRVHDFSSSMVRSWSDLKSRQLEETFAKFAQEAEERLVSGGFDHERIDLERAVDLRYVGQSFELRVPVESNSVTDSTLDRIADDFHRLHKQRYGHASRSEAIELVTVRLRARGLVETPEIVPATRDGSQSKACTSTRSVQFDGAEMETPVYKRKLLPEGAKWDGPAIIEGADTTIVVQPAHVASVDEYGTIHIDTQP